MVKGITELALGALTTAATTTIITTCLPVAVWQTKAHTVWQADPISVVTAIACAAVAVDEAPVKTPLRVFDSQTSSLSISAISKEVTAVCTVPPGEFLPCVEARQAGDKAAVATIQSRRAG